MKGDMKKRHDYFVAVIYGKPKPIWRVRLLEGPWGECDVCQSEYEQLCIDYAGYTGARDNLATAKGKLDRALDKMATSKRLKAVYALVAAQFPGTRMWEQNEATYWVKPKKPTWKHTVEAGTENEHEVNFRSVHPELFDWRP
jgi:hypothetical protein